MKKIITGNFNGTALFIDIKNFLGISDMLSPQETCQFIFRVIEPLSDCINDHGGYICQIQGDAIFAVFGLKDKSEDHAKNAINCAISMQMILDSMNPVKMGDIRIPLAANIGIRSGDLYACQIKVVEHNEFTVLGKTANLASRYQKMNKHYDTNILIDETVFAYIKKNIVTRNLDKVEIEGCSTPVNLYEVVCFHSGKEHNEIQKTMNYKKGLASYMNEDWDEAFRCFSQVSDNKVSSYMMERCTLRKAFMDFIDPEKTNK